MTAPRSAAEVEALAVTAADHFYATGDRPPNISEADWKHILKGAAFAQAIAEVEGRDGSQADGDLDLAGEIEERLRGFGYVVIEAEAVAERDAEVVRLRGALERVQGLHDRDPDEGMGYYPDDSDEGKYGHMTNVCQTCGTPDEYGERWPCETRQAVDAALAEPPR